MDSHIACLRCGKRIAVKPEMVGQTILCPNCLDRVYVSESSKQEKPLPATSSAVDLEANLKTLDAAALLKRNQVAPEARSNSGLIVAGVALGILVVVGALIAYMLRPVKEPPTVALQTTNLPPAPEMDDEPDRDEPEPPEDDDDDAPRRGSKKLPANPSNLPSQPAAVKTSEPKVGEAEPKSDQPAPPLPQPILPGFAEVWRLPPASASGAAELLTPLGEATPVLRAGLRSADGDFRLAPIAIEPDGGPNSGAWTIKRVSNPLSAEGRIPLASVRRDGSNLLFAWAIPEQELPAGPLVNNCLLEIHDGKRRRVGQLREPVRAQPIVLDLENEKQVVETKVDDLPRLDGVRLEVVSLAGFSFDAKVRGGAKAFTTPAPSLVAAKPATPAMPVFPGAPRTPLATGPQPLVIEFGEIPGLEVRLRCTADEAGKFAIAVDPIYRDTQDHDLRVPKLLDRLEAEARRPMPAAERELGPEENKLKTWQTKAREQKGKEPLKTDPKRHQAWLNEHNRTMAKAAEFERNVNVYKQIIEKAETQLASIAKLREFLKQVTENQATIRYIIYSECGDPDLLLVSGGAGG